MKYRIWGGIVLLLVLLFAANLFLGSARIPFRAVLGILAGDRKSTRLNSSHMA